MKEFEGKTAIVTGGSRGIGRGIALRLAKGGANVVITYAGNAAAAQEAAAEMTALGVKAQAVQADAADLTSAAAVVAAATELGGTVDILVNNAGITRDNLLMRMKDEEFDAVINTNLRGVYAMMKAVSKPMMKARYGRIVNISSIVGVYGNAGQVNYAAAKAGVIGMTKSVAKELGSRGITCNAVAPGFIETDMTAALPEDVKEKLKAQITLGRLGQVEDVAEAVAYLASDVASYVTGQVLEVAGGLM
ncbi:MAG: 3-oxoacyl-[acyl-carrier-protein] reductase [Eubacterium sp.]|nr:3-oxoacyl-[acyl-carrier-protein] reductase [Eubacterium sp.]